MLITLACVLVSSVLVASLTAYAQASNRAVEDYREQRYGRYAGEGAIDAAVNWARYQPDVALDPAQSTPDPCVYQFSTVADGVVTVSCGAEAGSGSGIDPAAGLKPPEAILALGRRQNQSAPYNSAACEGWATSLLDGLGWLFSSTDMPGSAKEAKWVEQGIKLRRRDGVGTEL
ncbi:MAG: hypothetical protein KDB69_08710, partial [Acidimicrobiia bacterium]|nr:hypothetical protein [Acidimicrobiia bacterium]